MRFPAALGVASASLFLAGLASAETPAEAASAPAPAASPTPASVPAGSGGTTASAPAVPTVTVVPNDLDQPQLEAVPNARDTLGGHFVIGGAVGAKWGFGSFSEGSKQSQALGTGLALNLDLGVGLSRNIVLGVWGEFDDYSSASACPSCSTTSYAGGPFLRYHIVQGTRFDPWGAIAIGVRQTKLDPGAGNATSSFFGPDWLRLTLGGDWYPFANLGVGPYVEFDVGAYNKHPNSSTVNTAVHTGLGTGLRIVLDFPGK
ncbi:MAG: hypothetical protein ABJB12_23110 [Pseudomonadota bacterium]